MKKFFFLFLIIVITGNAKAQLANTSWKNVYYIPDSTDMVLQFKQDTLLLNYLQDSSNAELMTYKINGDTLILTKVSGISPCGDEKGLYKITMKDDKLYLSVLEDSCETRANAMPATPYTKMP